MSSDELIRMAVPDAASSPIKRKISDFAPTSMPRVGSSSSQIFGRGGEPLPDDDLLLVAAREDPHGRLDVGRPDLQLRDVLAARGRAHGGQATKNRGKIGALSTIATFSRTERLATSPDRFRSSGTSAKPAAIASRGVRTRTGRPSTRTSPPTWRCRPKSVASRADRARPDEPGEADDLAGVQREVDGLR